MSNYIRISHFDTANGKGIGTVLWLAGCPHHCEGCHNITTWEPSVGQPFTEETLREVLKTMENPHIKRLTLSGGDPLAVYNRATSLTVSEELKVLYPDKVIWCYTGYKWEDVKDLEIMKHIDVLVDGKFIQEQKDISLRFCGSTNQRVIDVPQSLEQDKVVLIDLSD